MTSRTTLRVELAAQARAAGVDRLLLKVADRCSSIVAGARMRAIMASLAEHGANVEIGWPVTITGPDTIHIGSDVSIGPSALLSAVDSEIRIGNKVIMAAEVALIAGDHNTGVVGAYMADVTEKREEDDLPIVIEDDVWIGTRAIVLKGVRLGRGSVVAAGAVVTRDVPAYSVVAGVPARVVSERFDGDTRARHEALLEKRTRGR